MTKTIVISPRTMLAWLSGKKIADSSVNVSPDAKIVSAVYLSGSGEFWVNVQAGSFDDQLAEKRLPQEFRMEVQK